VCAERLTLEKSKHGRLNAQSSRSKGNTAGNKKTEKAPLRILRKGLDVVDPAVNPVKKKPKSATCPQPGTQGQRTAHRRNHLLKKTA
jgi:hypothetical protein